MVLAVLPSDTRPNDDELDPPIAFGRYLLSRRLGHGGFATVFLALEASASGDSREVVVKRLHEHLCLDERAREAFLDEARLALSLRHENVVSARDFGAIDGRPFLAMEYLLGADLERVLERLRSQNERLHPELAVQIALDALEGLAYLHGRRDAQGRPAPVVHRDVSPHNLFVTQQGVVKLLDFGIAKARARAIETTTGVIKGKFAYMSPEQASGEAVEPSADVWSMGVVLWEMVAGQRLFEASSAFSTLSSSLLARAPRLDQVCDAPQALADVVERALARAPRDRYATGREMLDALRALPLAVPSDRTRVAALVLDLFGPALVRAREESELRRVRAQTRPAPPDDPRPSRVPRWLAALALCVGSALLALLLQRRLEAPPVVRAPQRELSGPAPAPLRDVADAPVPPSAPPAAEESVRAAPKPGARAPLAEGRLTLVATPWAEVSRAGRRLGTTPLVEVALPAGRHTLVLENPAVEGARVLEVTVEPGEASTLRVELSALARAP